MLGSAVVEQRVSLITLGVADLARAKAFYEALGHTIKVGRTDLGIERAELAERAGISYSYLAAIENGQKQPSSQVLLALAEALGLRSHELMRSAEMRQVRNQRGPTEDYPQWLTGRERVQRMEEPAAFARMASAPTPLPVDFLGEMERLARDLSESDREMLLAMARKLAGHYKP